MKSRLILAIFLFFLDYESNQNRLSAEPKKDENCWYVIDEVKVTRTEPEITFFDVKNTFYTTTKTKAEEIKENIDRNTPYLGVIFRACGVRSQKEETL